jgi:quercetin dioxygenase-like cupin family protein
VVNGRLRLARTGHKSETKREVPLIKAGDKIMDRRGYGLIFRQTAHETQGELLEMEAFYPPHGPMPPPHFHPQQEEQFQVLAGEFRVTRGAETVTYKTGDRFTIPAGLPHAMHNVADEKGHLLWQTRPALQSERFFDAVWRMDYDEAAQQTGGFGRLLRLALIFQAHQREVRLSSPVQRTLLKLLAPLGRLAGYQIGR